MDAEKMLSAARFALVAISGAGREESCLDGFLRCKDMETEFFLSLPEGDRIALKINEDSVEAERSGRENYKINFFKNNVSILSISDSQAIQFSTHKLLFRKTDDTFELYLSYDLSGTDKQSLKIKCTKL